MDRPVTGWIWILWFAGTSDVNHGLDRKAAAVMKRGQLE